MRRAPKSSIYRNEVTSCAVAAVLEAVAAIESGRSAPQPMDTPALLRADKLGDELDPVSFGLQYLNTMT
ncbi:hypothetical protein [Bradyrhizobium sp. S3.5.5]|uniref:hypothetical protein n=1 Tax=unclassified Bradyrhizobium TaxID=2631580 RepID=UPI0033923F02